jgi:signal transduction histidine kinase
VRVDWQVEPQAESAWHGIQRWTRWLGSGVLGVVLLVGVVLPHGLDAAHRIGLAAVLGAAVALWAVLLAVRVRDGRLDALLCLLLGLLGVAATSLYPNGLGYLITFMALIRAAMHLPSRVSVVLAGVLLAVLVAVPTAVGIPLESAGTLTVGAAFVYLVADLAAVSIAGRVRAERLLKAEERGAVAAAQAAVLRERGALAREIHDIVAHTFAGLALQLETAKVLADRTGADPRLAEQLARAHRLTSSGIADAKRAVEALRGGALPGPALLPDLVAEAGRAWGLPVGYAVTGEPRAIPPEHGLAVYRTVQEALSNTARHAGPGAAATVAVRWAADSVAVEVTDTGRGRAPSDGEPGTGYGLSGMAERAELLGGHLTAGPGGDGYRVLLTLPLEAR